VLSTADRGARAALDLGARAARWPAPARRWWSLPYDRHLAAGTPIVPKRLAEATTVEATRLAGYALRCAAAPRDHPGGAPAGPHGRAPAWPRTRSR
jgi:hypothetical protein